LPQQNRLDPTRRNSTDPNGPCLNLTALQNLNTP